MMSQTNVDYLFQLTAPAERGSSSPQYAPDRRPAFDKHLAQATETSRDPARKPDVKIKPIDSPRPEHHQRFDSEPDDAPAASEETQSPACAACGEPETSAGGSDAKNPPLDQQGVTDRADAVVDNRRESTDPQDEFSSESGDSNETQKDASALPEAAVLTASAIASAAIDAAVVAPEPSAGDVAAEGIRDEATVTTNSTAKEGGDVERQPVGAAAPSPKKLQAASVHDAAVDLNVNASQDAQQADQIASTAVADESSAEVDSAGAGADAKRSRETRDARATSHEAPANGRFDLPATSVVQPAKSGRPANSKADKTPAGARRTDEKSKSDDVRPSSNSRADARTESAVAANKVVAAAVANPSAASPSATASGDDAAKQAAPTASKSVGVQTDLLHQSLGRSTRAGAAAGRGSRSAAADELPHIDATRFVGRVAKAVQTAHERGGSLQLRLSPPELGSLRLELSVQDGVMSACLETESSAARKVLLDHLPALRDRLAEQNIRIERFDVDVRQDGSSGQADPRASQRDQHQRQPPDSGPRQSTSRQPATDSDHRDPAPNYPRQTNSGINLLA